MHIDDLTTDLATLQDKVKQLESENGLLTKANYYLRDVNVKLIAKVVELEDIVKPKRLTFSDYVYVQHSTSSGTSSASDIYMPTNGTCAIIGASSLGPSSIATTVHSTFEWTDRIVSKNLKIIKFFDQHIHTPPAGTTSSPSSGIVNIPCTNTVTTASAPALVPSSKQSIMSSGQSHNPSRWNTKCTMCGSDAYQGAFMVECSQGCQI